MPCSAGRRSPERRRMNSRPPLIPRGRVVAAASRTALPTGETTRPFSSRPRACVAIAAPACHLTSRHTRRGGQGRQRAGQPLAMHGKVGVVACMHAARERRGQGGTHSYEYSASDCMHACTAPSRCMPAVSRVL